MLFISSKPSSSQRILGLPIGLLGMGFHLLIFCTLLSSAMRSTWPNQFSLCFLINLIIFCPFNMSLISWLVWYSQTVCWNGEVVNHIWGVQPSSKFVVYLNLKVKNKNISGCVLWTLKFMHSNSFIWGSFYPSVAKYESLRFSFLCTVYERKYEKWYDYIQGVINKRPDWALCA